MGLADKTIRVLVGMAECDFTAGGVTIATVLPEFSTFNSLTSSITSFVFSRNSGASRIDNIVVSFDDTTAAVPLPASLPLVLAGFGALCLVRRKQTNKA